jgi:hypothetical protein
MVAKVKVIWFAVVILAHVSGAVVIQTTNPHHRHGVKKSPLVRSI